MIKKPLRLAPSVLPPNGARDSERPPHLPCPSLGLRVPRVPGSPGAHGASAHSWSHALQVLMRRRAGLGPVGWKTLQQRGRATPSLMSAVGSAARSSSASALTSGAQAGGCGWGSAAGAAPGAGWSAVLPLLVAATACSSSSSLAMASGGPGDSGTRRAARSWAAGDSATLAGRQDAAGWVEPWAGGAEPRL